MFIYCRYIVYICIYIYTVYVYSVHIYIYSENQQKPLPVQDHMFLHPCASAAKGNGSRRAWGGRDLCLERHIGKGATLLWPGGTIWFVGSGIQLHHFHLLIRDHSFGVWGDQAISGWAATNLSRLVAEPGSKGRYQGPYNGFDFGYNSRWKGWVKLLEVKLQG